ncbi:glycosyltransferase family 4 protein [Collinsella sp. CLA-AA-H302]|uniref:glycosyltransferase family 4 protein n=1 Tax=Collinsella sp. CLA-AA-H302 TaxID=3136217 RepID=UPI0032C18877
MALTYVIFSAQYPPHMGGIESFTRNMAYALTEKGARVIVVTNDTNSIGIDIETDCGVEVLRLSCFPFVDGRFPVAKHDEKNRNLWKWLESQDVDGVLINARFYLHSILGMKYARRKGLTPVVLDHGSAHLSFSSPYLDPFVRIYEHAITLRGKRYKPAYYGVSEKSAEWLRHFGITAKGVIPNAIDAEKYRNMSSGRDFRNELGLGEDPVIVSYVGRFIPEKGIKSIIDTSKSYRLNELGVHFVLAGDGPMSSAVELAQGESLHWVGRLSASDVSALLQQSNLLCLPTRSEGFSTILLEAAACGCPAVVTDVGGARELIPSSDYGTIIKSMSAESVEMAVYQMASSRSVLNKQSKSIQELVELGHTWANSADKLCFAFAKARD